jgi:ubiquinone/menaquinone biosynthesis C-methylase UbiE
VLLEPFLPETVRAAYDVVAADYAEAFAKDLEQLPVDRAVLDAGARLLTSQRPLLDIGCGPGQVGTYLSQRGVPVVGVDLALGMLHVARQRTENLQLACADMRWLPVRARSCSGAAIFYSLQHLPRGAIGEMFAELRRVFVPDGILILATHLGAGEVFSSEFLGHHIDPVGGTLYAEEELERALTDESFILKEVRYRDPLPHEHQSKRIYITVRLADSS